MRIIQIISVFFFISTSVMSQASLGIKAGLNVSGGSIADVGALETNVIFSFHAGVYSKFQISNKIAIQPELLYSLQGFNYMKFSPIPFEVRNEYLLFPILFQYSVKPWLSIHIGPQVGYLLSYKDGSFDVTNFVRSRYDIGGVIGLGVDTPSGVGGGLRYTIQWTDYTDGLAIKNMTNIQLYISYALKKF